MSNGLWTPYIKRNAGIIIAGIALELLLGDFKNSFLSYPIGAILAVFYVYLLYVVYALSDKHPRLRSLYDTYAATSSLATLVGILILFGLIRQSDEHAPILFTALGFTRMTSSWVFCLIMIHFISILGIQSIDDLMHFRKRKLLPMLSHVCVFVIMATAVFTSGDKVRVQVTAMQGEPTHTGQYADHGYQLPFTITLQRFSLEFYPPKLTIVDTTTGQLSNDNIVLTDSLKAGRMGEWNVEVKQYLRTALPDSTTTFRAMRHVGATPAALLTVTHQPSGKIITGWVSAESFLSQPHYLQLDDKFALIMPQQQAKHYQSDIEIERHQSSAVSHHQIEVNHPAHIGPWKVYQVGYDTMLGEWSRSSTLECVRDRGYAIIHVALWMLLLISLLMFIRAKKNKTSS